MRIVCQTLRFITKILLRFRGGIQPDARMIKKKLGTAKRDKRKGKEEEFAYKEERAYEEYDRAIQVFKDCNV